MTTFDRNKVEAFLVNEFGATLRDLLGNTAEVAALAIKVSAAMAACISMGDAEGVERCKKGFRGLLELERVIAAEAQIDTAERIFSGMANMAGAMIVAVV